MVLSALVYFILKNYNSPGKNVTDLQIDTTAISKPAVKTLSSDILNQLNTAQNYLNNNTPLKALAIYKNLSKQQVPEAMYKYADYALQNKNAEIKCIESFELLIKAATDGYAPAKRTLGFLYSFADNIPALQQNNYHSRCYFTKNVSKGAKLLMEATLSGDTTAARYLYELNSATPQ